MKSFLAVLPIALLVSLSPAQDKPAAPVANPQNTMQAEKSAPGADVRPIFPHERWRNPQERGPACEGVPPMMGHQRSWGPCCMHCPMMAHHGLRHLIALKVLFLGLLLYGILNILLTIIVSLDMSKVGRFNGLWIPVTLLAGIPGSLIYALFRLGDKLQCKSGQ